MIILKSKWFLFVGVLVIVLVVLYFLGRKSVHTELTIPATPEEIWSILMDVPGYKEWNPVLIPIEGELVEGNKLKYRMIQPGGTESVVDSKVVKIIEHKLLNQYGGIPGFLTFDHRYILEPVNGGTRVTIHEDYRGIGVLFWNTSWVESAYQKVNKALRDRVAQLKKKE
jgi:hypothetical protein